MKESLYHQLADEVLEKLYDFVDKIPTQQDLDVELQYGVLTVELESGKQFIVNKHTPTRQVWVSSPVSGASYFAYDEASERWSPVRTRTKGDDLVVFIKSEITEAVENSL